jgi:hypothetical protein
MARRYTSATERRNRDREIQRLAANRRIGHDHAYLIVYGVPILRVLVPLVLAVVIAVLLWWKVDHKVIGFFAAIGGIVLTLAYVANLVGTSSVHSRMMAKATGRPPRPVWWHGVGAAGVVLMALAFVVIPR